MRNRTKLRDLQIKHVTFSGGEIPWNLNIFLYKGGAATHRRLVHAAVESGKLGPELPERVELTERIHEFICGKAAGGEPRGTTGGRFNSLRSFFKFVDQDSLFLTIKTFEDCYLKWTASLLYRVRLKGADWKSSNALAYRTANGYASTVGTILNAVLNRATGIKAHSGLRYKNPRKTAVGVQAEKQSLSDTFSFGHMLQDICDALTIDVISTSPLPLEIKLRNGKSLLLGSPMQDNGATSNSLLTRSRAALVNIRIETELAMFIAQTAINTTQATHSTFRNFFYVSHLDGYQVKDYKARRGGTVLFEIFKEYKAHFERYLTWRRHFFPRSSLLFPFIKQIGSSENYLFTAERLRKICSDLDLPFIGPRKLRNTRVNWLLRESGSPDLTAEMAQHTKETLFRAYHRPSLQRAISESHNFWTEYNPHSDEARFALANEISKAQAAAGPGNCAGAPKKSFNAPPDAPDPDCLKKSGCIWCDAHRDVDTFEYVWSLATFRHLKLIEIAKASLFIQKTEKPLTARLTLEKIDSRLAWFESSSVTRNEWATNARELINAGEYHPDYANLIDFLEGRK